MSGVVAEKKAWFGPKRSGIGFRPTSWQGWAITFAVIAAIVVLKRVVFAH